MPEKIIDLFTNIDDQIISLQEKVQENTNCVCYLLKQKQVYYAMFPTGDQIKLLLTKFRALPNVQLTTDAVKQALETVLYNCQLFYQVQEYRRYLKCKGKIDNDMEQIYPSWQQNMQTQLQFLANLAPLLHGQASAAFPGLMYQGLPPEVFYDEQVAANSCQKKSQQIVMEVLATTTALNLTTKDIMETLYPKEALAALYQLDFLEQDATKLSHYISLRQQHLQLLATTDDLDVGFARENDSLFLEINTVFDVHVAAVISDRIYKKGQGAFAISDYLLNGNVNRFTSKHGARALVNATNRITYQNAFISNILLRLLLSLQTPDNEDERLLETIKKYLHEETVDEQQLIKLLADNLLLLSLAIDHFDYALLQHGQKQQQALTLLETIDDTNLQTNIKKILQQVKLI